MQRRRARDAGLLLLALVAGCSGEPTGSNAPPPIAGATSGDDTAAVTLTTLAETAEPEPDPCAMDGDDGSDAPMDDDADDGSDGAFKFDVGGPEGSHGFSLSCDDVAASPSNLGCTFWAVDLPNDERGTEMSPPASEQPFAIVIANVSALGEATVRVYVGADDTATNTALLAPLETFVIDLGDASISAATSTSDGVAFRIESDVPIAAYQFNPAANTVEVYSNDASLLLPQNALGQDYVASTADGILLGMGPSDDMPVNAGGFVSIVATVDDTTVEIMPTAPLVGDLGDAITLDRGEVATIISDALSDGAGNLSGTRIHADQPIAVFSGNVATAIPAGSGVCCADHLEHQLLPATAWGNSYAVAPPPNPSGNGTAPAMYRVLSGSEGAEFHWCPSRPDGAPDDLAANAGAWFIAPDGFTVRSTGEDESFTITQFTLSNTEIGKTGLGDPAMIVLPPLGQQQERSLFVVPSGYQANWANVVVGDSGEIRLDGELIEEDQLVELGPVDGVMYRYAQLELAAGTHALEAEAGASVTVIGVDNAVSYGFAGASGLKVLSLPPAAG